MTSLRKLLLAGNPIRTLRRCQLFGFCCLSHYFLFNMTICFILNISSASSLVSGPTPILLKYLRSRLSADEGNASFSCKVDDFYYASASSS